MRDHLDRLSVAALAMFNRGQQDISEEELGTDLAVLDPSLMERSRPVETGQRIIGEFFFVHAPEARMLTGAGDAGANSAVQPPREALRRSYEFLHATFGEYLVAHRVMTELADVAARVFAGRRGPTEPDDDLLYALLSHQAFAARGSTLTFSTEIFAGLPDDDRGKVLEVLEMLLGNYRHRQGTTRYASYRPRPADTVRELAFYSANLVTLRGMLEPEQESVSLTRLLRCTADDAMGQWRSMVMLWKSGLDPDCMQAMLATVELSDDEPAIQAHEILGSTSQSGENDTISIENEFSLARLTNDQALEERLRYGAAVVNDYLISYSDTSWKSEIASWLIPNVAGEPVGGMWGDPPATTPAEDIAYIARLIFRYLRSNGGRASKADGLLELLFGLPRVFEIDSLALAITTLSNPELLAKIPDLRNAEIYGPYINFLRELLPDASRDGVSDEAVEVGQKIIRDFANEPESPHRF